MKSSKITKLAKQGFSAQQIADKIGITMNTAYNSDAFCIAFSKGYAK